MYFLDLHPSQWLQAHRAVLKLSLDHPAQIAYFIHLSIYLISQLTGTETACPAFNLDNCAEVELHSEKTPYGEIIYGHFCHLCDIALDGAQLAHGMLNCPLKTRRPTESFVSAHLSQSNVILKVILSMT